jgi:hypothetical protein
VRFHGLPVGRFTAGVARSLGFNITRTSDSDGSSDHVVLTPSDTERTRGKHQRACKELAKNTDFISFADFRVSGSGTLTPAEPAGTS